MISKSDWVGREPEVNGTYIIKCSLLGKSEHYSPERCIPTL